MAIRAKTEQATGTPEAAGEKKPQAAKFPIEKLSVNCRQLFGNNLHPLLEGIGVVGVVLFLLFWIYLLKKAFQYLRVTSDMRLMNLAMIVIAFFAIENIADATFTSNRGLYFMMFLGVIYVEMAQKTDEKKNNKMIL